MITPLLTSSIRAARTAVLFGVCAAMILINAKKIINSKVAGKIPSQPTLDLNFVIILLSYSYLVLLNFHDSL